MPELPEVETVVRQLRPHVLNKKIVKVDILRENQWKNIAPKDAMKILTDKNFLQISRRAKYIKLNLDHDYCLYIHLRMSGKLIWVNSWELFNNYSRTIFYFADKTSLQFNDVRTLGTLDIGKVNAKLKFIEKLGIEPLDINFKIKNLQELLAASKVEIKDFLLDQRKIVGIGNIYANEILFKCGIHPKRTANSLNFKEIRKLFNAIPAILGLAIEHMGTSLGDGASEYRTIYNTGGEFQNFLKIYGRKDEQCYTCKGQIVRIVQKGRSSFVCESCQK